MIGYFSLSSYLLSISFLEHLALSILELFQTSQEILREWDPMIGCVIPTLVIYLSPWWQINRHRLWKFEQYKLSRPMIGYLSLWSYFVDFSFWTSCTLHILTLTDQCSRSPLSNLEYGLDWIIGCVLYRSSFFGSLIDNPSIFSTTR